ncbi:MAG: winged helix-turn-helix domain-containing protein, partial [Candidatus Polarisedimenticolia bacterium]
MAGIRYRFGEFVLSPTRRLLHGGGREIPLIPRYFDLLLLLVERRGEAVSRRDIFDRVWSDVVVSDGALSQAVRSLRRALGDDPRQPVFIRTMSRHGYCFIHPDVRVEPEGRPAPLLPDPPAPAPPASVLVERLMDASIPLDERRDAAEALHAGGTPEALRLMDERPPQPDALALMRDARWDVPGAGEVPVLGRPGGLAALWRLAIWRLRQAAGVAATRWGSA